MATQRRAPIRAKAPTTALSNSAPPRSAVEVIRNPETAKISGHLAERSKREHPPAAAAHGQGTGPSPIAIAY